VRKWHEVTTRALQAAVAGRPVRTLPPLDLSAGTEFQRKVWAALLKIQCGKTASYGEIARSLGSTGAARAVGAACGANPVPVLVPCHRVLAANHKLGGFSGGLDWKRKLLAAENQL
jgi:O-6-methylguanine DNA methyltransferase